MSEQVLRMSDAAPLPGAVLRRSSDEIVAERAKSPLLDGLYRYEFFKAMAGLSHLYVGFATLVDTAIAQQTPP